MSPSIRAATPDDLDALVEGNRAMASETEDIALNLETLRTGIRAILNGDQPGAYWVLEDGGQVAAQLMITFEWSDWRNAPLWWIQSVYVWPDHRRRGHYRRLYARMRDEAQRAGAAGLRLYVEVENHRAQQTYASLGMNGDRYRMYEAMFTEH